MRAARGRLASAAAPAGPTARRRYGNMLDGATPDGIVMYSTTSYRAGRPHGQAKTAKALEVAESAWHGPKRVTRAKQNRAPVHLMAAYGPNGTLSTVRVRGS
jgi:hypothetical protein